jgi:hypothetical protein
MRVIYAPPVNVQNAVQPPSVGWNGALKVSFSATWTLGSAGGWLDTDLVIDGGCEPLAATQISFGGLD